MRKIPSRNQWGEKKITMRAIRHLNIGFVKPQFLEIFRACLGKVQSNLSDTAVRRGWHRDIQRLPLIWKKICIYLRISQNDKTRTAHEICTLPHPCAAMTSHMELQRQHMYLCEKLQESIFWVKTKNIWWVNLKREMTEVNQDESLFNKSSFSETLKVFYDLDEAWANAHQSFMPHCLRPLLIHFQARLNLTKKLSLKIVNM